jgi:cytochrome c oxidase subunit 2
MHRLPLDALRLETLSRVARPLAACLAVPLGGCAGVQSTFSAFGAEALTTRTLATIMFASAAALTVGVLALAWHAVRAPEGKLDHSGGMRLILWLGAVGPTVLLTALLLLSLPTMRPLTAAPGDLRIAVDGEQFWWRVRYASGDEIDSGAVETANEIHVPVGRAVTFLLESPDVIHSFWIPGLAGKVDMIPGRTNELVVRATAAGVFRGTCAEFCGLSHANMAFDVVAMDGAAFDEWLDALARPAAEFAHEGRSLFAEYGCDGCHAVRGHFAGSPIGPDLTHLAARRSLGAGTAPLTQDALASFIVDSAALKPGSLMPPFEHMPRADAQLIAAYLLELD